MQDLVEHITQLLLENNMMLATAESCTGGLLAASITEKSGASEVFERGFVTYSNQAKSDLLGVDPDIIDRVGAVSAETAEAMANGALNNSQADLAVSITGIAGPDGGTEEKPVGLVFLGYALKDKAHGSIKCSFLGNRQDIRTQAATEALNFLISLLEGKV